MVYGVWRHPIRITRALFKVRKYLSKSIFADILGIGGKKEQIVELSVYRSEDKSADDDVLSASENPEVAATKQKLSDLVVDDEESQVAEKLRECCDDFGREKPEMLRQSAAFLLKLGMLYRTYATNGKGIQQKLNFIKSAALIFGAMVRYEQIENEEGLEMSKCEIRKLQDEIQTAASLRKSFNVLKISNVLKGVLEECRVEVSAKFNDVLRTTEESEGKVRRERLEEAYELSTKHHLDIMRKAAEECQDIMGKPPCKFTIVGLGSLARKETTLYSDFQHAIVLEDGITESPSLDDVMEYFRWYTTIFQIITIGFGETLITNVDVKSLNDLYSENQSKKWFSDQYTPYGICFDSMMPNACKIPLGRQEPTKNRKHTIELIQPVSRMADLLTREEDIRNGYHLSEILSKIIFVFGNQEVYDCYLKALHHTRSQQTAKTFLVQQLQRLVFPNITTSHPWFLYAVQERLTSVLSCLANLFELRSQSGFQIVHELLDNGAIDLYMYYELMDAVSVGLEIKIKIHHLILIHKARNFSHVQVTNLVEEERVVSCYKTVMQYTILLQHQLLVLLREDGILEMQLFPDETFWENNKIITRRLGMQVLWREVEVGLDRTYEAIDKYEKHAEISSAEAKFVIRVASDALSTVFQHTVFLQRSIDWIKKSDFPLSGKLESYCRLFLQFLKDDNQALIYFYSMLFLIHYEQKNFQQAYEDYEKWQQLRHSQQNHRTYRRNHWMDFLQVEVINQVTVTDDSLERIKQQIAAEADIPERWVLTVQYCTVLLKMNQEGKAKKRLQMMAKRKRAKPEYLKVLMEFLLLFLGSGIRITSVQIFKKLQNANSSIRNKFLSICNISGMEQEILKQRSEHCKKLVRDIRLESTEIRILQHNYTTSLFEALSLAVDCFSSDRTKSASLLWIILHSRSVTKPVMLESVLLLFRHFWCDQSLQAVDGKIMDVDKSSDTIPREHEHETVTVPLSDSISTQVSDLVVDDEESQVAEKLRECCDDFGREKPEMLRQSAAFLLKLGKLYRTYATNGKGIQQKLNFIKSAALIFGAMVRYEQIENEEGLEMSKCEIRKLQDEIQTAASLRKSFNVLKISHVLKGVLEECRVEVSEKFNDVLRTTEESEGKVRRERLEEAYELSTKHHLDIMRKAAEECQDIMGKPPCTFTIVGLGSLAKKETTLYSDFQHAIVLEDGITESPSFDDVMEYFRWYTTIFQIITIGFGETLITNVDVKSLNDLYSENQSKKWFSDQYTPYGICFDSMMPNSCKIPLGRQEPTKNRKHTIELIQPVSRMADLLTREEDIRNGYHLSEILSKTIFVFGNQEVYDCYLKALHHTRSQQTAKIRLEQQLQQLLFPNITTSHPWFLYAVQERLTSLLSCLANLFELRSQSGFQIVHELLENGAIDLYMYYELMDAVGVGMEIRIKIHHLILIHKARNFSHVQVTNLVEEERVVSCYKTVMQCTILLQHQLLRLLGKDDILEMQLFSDETYWENNKIITCRLGMQVFWREVEVGLDRTYEAINKYEKHAEISSAEAKFVIRVASDALSTVFQHTVFLQHSILWIQDSDFSLSGKLESHCRLFLQFLKDDNQALIYFYSMLFLIHYEQKHFQQAYEDYEKWQQLRHSQQNHHTYRRNHWMDFLQVEVLNQVTVTDDTLERIKQQIAAEADSPERWVLTVQYCTVLLKKNQEGKAKKRLQMMAKRKRAKPEFLEVLMESLLVFLGAGIRITSVKIFKMLQNANTSERKKFLSIYNISGMKQETLKQRKLASDIRLESTDIRTLQHNYRTPLFEALSLAVDCFFSTKSASLLWSILHSPSVTKPMMLDSVLMLFRHFGKIIVASESKDVPISKEGGKIDVGGCAVAFHRGFFDDVSKVHAKSEIDSSKWPPKYSCITAIPRVHAERNLLKRALVAMKSWCMKNSTYSRKIEVHVLHLQNDSSTWEVVVRLPQNDQKVFHKEKKKKKKNHVIEGHVYAGKGNNFSLAFFLQNDLNLKAVEDVMANKHLELHLNFTPISVASNDIISANLNCTDANFRFPKDFKISFKIDGQFVRQTKKAFSHSNLIGTSSEAIDITFECEVRQNERLADGPHNFSYEWRPKIAPLPRQPGLMRVTAEIEGAGAIRDLHLLGTGNTHDHRQYQSPGSAERNDDSVGQSQQAGPS